MSNLITANTGITARYLIMVGNLNTASHRIILNLISQIKIIHLISNQITVSNQTTTSLL